MAFIQAVMMAYRCGTGTYLAFSSNLYTKNIRHRIYLL